MNSSNFLKGLEYILLPHLEKLLPFHENQFAYRPATGCIDAITFLKETVMYYNSQPYDVYCAMTYLSKAYDRINASLSCDKMRETNLPGHVSVLINCMCNNGFGCPSYVGQMSHE